MISISACCRLNPLPPNLPLDSSSSSPSLPTRTRTHHVDIPRKSSNETSSYWSKNLMAIASTIVISLEMGDIVSNINNGQSYTMARASEEVAIENQLLLLLPSNNNNNNKSVTRWSDKRSCPPWHINSLETIVPENLPRPSARRRWEGVAYSSKSAPSVKFFVVGPRTSCFSL